MIARASVPGRTTSTRSPLAGAGMIVVVLKKRSSAAGMPTMARRFSPRRAVSRSSTAAWAVVARGKVAGRLMTVPARAGAGSGRRSLSADQLEVGLLERPADGP